MREALERDTIVFMTEAETKSVSEEDLQDSRIYEASFHLVSTLNDDSALAEVAEIRTFLEARVATIRGLGAPMLMELAYPIQKDIDRTRHTFTRSYFGWFVFETTPEAAHAAKEMLTTRSSVIRALLIKTSAHAAEDRKHPATVSVLLAEEPLEVLGDPELSISKDTTPIDAPEKGSIDIAQVDAEIAKLVV